MIKFDFTGKRILVTGASSGIGASICKTLSDSGAEVIMVAKDADKLKIMCNFAREIRNYNSFTDGETEFCEH